MISPYVYEQLAYIDDDEECCSSMFDVVDDVDDDRGDVDEPIEMITESYSMFYSHKTKVTSWQPPLESWNAFNAITAAANCQQQQQTSRESELKNTGEVEIGEHLIAPSLKGHQTGEQCEASATTTTNVAAHPSMNESLPYGWEAAFDGQGVPYYINHNTCTTTYQYPFQRRDDEIPIPKPRTVTIQRSDHPKIPFGFVAGSEAPVIVRSVNTNGPSDGLLQAEDQILQVNGENVESAPRNVVINKIKSCKQSVTLTVCQPIPFNNPPPPLQLSSVSSSSTSTSSTSTTNMNQVLHPNTTPIIVGLPSDCKYNSNDSDIPVIPNILKVFLENGQTKTFKYDSTTTIKVVLDAIIDRMSIQMRHHYGLVTELIRPKKGRNLMCLLDPNELVTNVSIFSINCLFFYYINLFLLYPNKQTNKQKVAMRPNAHNLRCLFRQVYIMPNPLEIYQHDPISFDYLYQQCVNDMVQERFQPENKYELCIRLSSLSIYVHALRNGYIEPKNGKVAMKRLDQEFGIEHFVPISLIHNMKRKELIKQLQQSIKREAPGLVMARQNSVTPFAAQVQYMKLLSDLPSYGGRLFTNNVTTFLARHDSMIACTIIRLEEITMMKIAKNVENVNQYDVEIYGFPQSSSSSCIENRNRHPITDRFLKELATKEPIVRLCLETYEAHEFVLLIKGYHRLLGEINNNGSPTTTSSSRNEIHHNTNINTNNSMRGQSTFMSELQIIWEQSPEDEWWNDGAPRYYGTHNVLGSGWNYLPQPSTSTSNRHKVDLAVAPPHFTQTKTYSSIKQTNPFQHLSGVTEVVKSIESRDSRLYINELASSTSSPPPPIPPSSSIGNDSATSIDMPSLVSMEILESHGHGLGKRVSLSTTGGKKIEDQQDVMFRVSEMSRILRDAERYLDEYTNFDGFENGGDKPTEPKQIGCKLTTFNELNSISTSSKKKDDESEMKNIVEHDDHCNTTQSVINSTTENNETNTKNNNSNSSSFGIQTGSRISTLDMFPQLMQAESDLAEVINSLNESSQALNEHNKQNNIEESIDKSSTSISSSTVGGGPKRRERLKPRPSSPVLRLSRLIAHLEQSGGQLDMIDLTQLKSIERDLSPEVSNSTLNSPTTIQPKMEFMKSEINNSSNNNNNNNSARVVAELDNLCDMMHEMKNTLIDNSKCSSMMMKSVSMETIPKRNMNLNSSTSSNSDHSELLSSFDQLNASINNLLINESSIEHEPSVESSKNDNDDLETSQFISNLVVPPPPPSESPTLMRKQADVIQKFWQATEDVKRICTARQIQQLQLQQQLQLRSIDIGNMSPNYHHRMGDPPAYPSNESAIMSSDSESEQNESISNNGSRTSYNRISNMMIPESKRICFQTKEMESIFAQSQHDIDCLLTRLEFVHTRRQSSQSVNSVKVNNNNSNNNDGELMHCTSNSKETLTVESRHFVTASKFFVKCATEGSFQLIDYLTECITLLERMFHASETLMFEMVTHSKISMLVDRLKEVASTYAYTVDTVRRLVSYTPDETITNANGNGSNNDDANDDDLIQSEIGVKGMTSDLSVVTGRANPYMDILMKNATNLANSLSALMRTLK
ncbi:Frmpd3p, partial [Blomia tropicalis]